jgi:hypothetical protein
VGSLNVTFPLGKKMLGHREARDAIAPPDRDFLLLGGLLRA